MADGPAAGMGDTEFRTGLFAVLPHLRAFARGLCGSADQADDLAQEAVVKAWAARARFEPGTSLRAWTFTILRNHFLNERRKAGREVPWDAQLAERTLIEPARQEEGLHLSDLERALLRLPAERREALLLVGAGGFSYEEAAAICHVATGTMKSRVARGRAALSAIMNSGSPAALRAE